MDREKVTVSVRIDKDVKEQFERVCKSMGLNISDAINIFVRKVISEGAIPFEVKLKSDQKDTNMEVIKDRGMSIQETLATFFKPADSKSVMELRDKLNRTEKIIEEPNPGGQRNVISHFSSLHERAMATHDNLFDVITPKGEEV